MCELLLLLREGIELRAGAELRDGAELWLEAPDVPYCLDGRPPPNEPLLLRSGAERSMLRLSLLRAGAWFS